MLDFQKNSSCLLIAVEKNYQEIAELLIKKKANIHAVDSLNQTALHKAAANGNIYLVKLLIEQGVEIDPETRDGSTPLYLAAGNRHYRVCQFLLDCGATVDRDIAILLGNIELVKQYLAQGIDTNSKIEKGYCKGETWLTIAVRYYYQGLIQLLLEHGARINEKEGSSLLSPLHIAAIGIKGKAHLELCEFLIARGADVNIRDKYGKTALHWSSQFGYQSIVELLVECGANVNTLDNAGKSPLFDAIHYGRLQIVKFLLIHNVEVNLREKRGFVPLDLAFSRPVDDEIAYEIVKLLITYGADIHIKDSKGLSPLHKAVIRKNKNIVEFLLAHGAREGLE
jgi:ankyrin repeat protein